MTRPVASPRANAERSRPSLATVALLLALLALPIAVWTVAAQSSARFAALIPVGRARLIVGNVDIDVELTQRSEVVLEATNMAPGDEVYGGITTNNIGSMDVRYRVGAAIAGELPDEWVTVATWSPAPGSSAEDCLAGPDAELVLDQPSAEPRGPLESIDPNRLSFLASGRSVATCLVVRLARGAPNEAQGRDLEVAVVVDAMQDPSELVGSGESRVERSAG